MMYFKAIAIYLLSLCTITFAICQTNSNTQNSTSGPLIDFKNMEHIGNVDERYQSYNIEVCEVVGGDFWIPYDLLDSVLQNTEKQGFEALKWKIEPISLYEKKLRHLAAALGPTYIRVSGTWANSAYFQNNDDIPLDDAPEGFSYILTREQWKGVVDYSKAVNGKIVTSFSISDGMHDENGVYQVDQVKELIDYTKSIDGDGRSALIINSTDSAFSFEIPEDAEQYLLTAEKLDTKSVSLNGAALELKDDDTLPEILGKKVKSGSVSSPAQSILFLSFTP